MRKLQYLFMALATLCFAVPAFAQSGGSAAINLVPIGAGIGMALAAGLCGLGQGRVGEVREAGGPIGRSTNLEPPVRIAIPFAVAGCSCSSEPNNSIWSPLE